MRSTSLISKKTKQYHAFHECLKLGRKFYVGRKFYSSLLWTQNYFAHTVNSKKLYKASFIKWKLFIEK
jgi:hypothetical protein